MEHIRIAIRDSTDSMNICFLDNKAGIKFHEATLQRFLKGTCNFLTLKFYGKDIDTIYPGCRLAFKYAGNDYWLTINSFEKNGYECSLTAYSLSLETNKEKRKAYKAQKWTFKQYLDYVDPEHSLTLGLNEVASQSMQLEWSGTDTILARLFSIANSFGAELEFVTELNDDYSLKRHVLNVYKVGNIGKDKTGMPIRVGKSLKVINYTANIDELYTAIRVHGKDGLTIAGLDKKVYDSDKKLLYYTQGDTLYAPQARDRFPAIAHKASDSFICLESEDTEHSSKEALYAYMLGELKKHSEPKIDYETEGYVDGEIGDRMLLIDSVHYDPPLYVEARISEQTISLLDKSKNKTTFTNYERKYSQIDESLIKIMEKMAEQKTPYIGNLITSNGNQFLNNAGTTKLTPSVIKGLEQATGLTFDWFKNGVKIATGDTLTVNASDFDRTAVYSYLAYMENQEVAKSEITISKVQDGADGATGPQGVPGRDGQNGRDGTNGQNAYLHVAYANSIDGRVDFSITSSSNRVYMGTYTDNIFNQSTDPTKYQWLRVKGDPGTPGKDGKNGIIYSSTEPTNPSAGQLWQAPNQPLKRYTGVSWVIHQFYADNVAAENLTVENGKFTKLVGTSIESGEFISSFKNVLVPWSRSYSSGRTILKDGNLYSEGTIDNLFPFKSEYTPVGMSSTVYKEDGETPRMTVSTTYGGIYLYNHEQDIGGTLSVDMLYDTGWVDLPLLKGTGNIRVRRYMKRYMLWFDNFVWNGSDNRNPVAILPEGFRTGRNQMLYATKWSLEYNDSEKFQLNADGSIHKISNVSTWGLAGFVEYF
ncbi:phage tail protein [Enterococcus cecorum]|uniref:phage tail protein n=1 Tax=Enterococcus cecorum TaxID=44008 RepID=UPI0022D6AADB|nr:phage tail protein [Enterococcus cecorum]CAI3279797.1 phage tail protein [Enterococcus cecorum]CAI3296141.1 phage tail protein [Enterococcus cecorum]CAI3314383.1 phage tail protein [Enterococcus cecorum]CAI3390859.1 phage tail protein [Enterococcus cecorum]CAI3394028.1 phage tail protein [Enterococcus cecorum]